MILQYHKAPLHTLDGVPAGKAGEWPGIKSNHFTPTRRMIRPVSKETVFNNDYLPIFGRKHFKTVRSKEYSYRSGIRVGNPFKTNNEKDDILFPAKINPEAKQITTKKYYFKYRDDYSKSCVQNMDNKHRNIAKEDLNFLQDLGFNKDEYTMFVNDNMKKKIEITRTNQINFARQLEEDRMNNLKIEQDNLKKDVDYVRVLDDWEKNIVLPRIDIKK